MEENNFTKEKTAELYEQVNKAMNCKLPVEPTFDDLKKFSKIKLKKSMSRKKFKKYYHIYVPKEIYNEYLVKLIIRPFAKAVVSSAINIPDLEPIEGENLPKVEMVYMDFKYGENGAK